MLYRTNCKLILNQQRQYCTNHKVILHQLQSHRTIKCASGKSIAKDQRTSCFLGDSVGLSKAVSMDSITGRMAAESTKRFKAMG